MSKVETASIAFIIESKEKGCGKSSFAGGKHAPLIRTCETWFRQFKNGDLNVKEDRKSVV